LEKNKKLKNWIKWKVKKVTFETQGKVKEELLKFYLKLME
jgi:hypothetical protein